MAYAMMWPNGKERGGDRRSTDFNVEKNQHRSKEDIDRATISRARFILKHAPETAKLVRDGHPNCGGWRTPRDYFPVVALTVQLVSPNLVAGERPVIIFLLHSGY